MRSFWGELRRRHVIRIIFAYTVMSWLIIQVGAILLPAFGAPEWSLKALVIILLIGLPFAIVLSWIFDLTPDGIVVSKSAEESDNNRTSRAEVYSYSELQPFELSELNLSKVKLNPLVGRQEELTLLRNRIEQAKQGHGGFVLISGEPGQGKTRLGEEALSISRTLDMLPLTGHAYEELGAPFIVTTEILEEIIRVFPTAILPNVLGNTASEITRLVPDLYRIFPNIQKSIELPAGQQQRYLFNALLDMVLRLSKVKPLVFLLDDLQWTDVSSAQMLEHFIPHISNHSILIVITYRDTEHDLGEPFKRTLNTLHRVPNVLRISLKEFSLADIEQYISHTSNKKPPIELCKLLLQETNGNVFFVQSVYQHLSDQGALFDSSGEWSQDITNKKLDLPDSVRIVTTHRLNNLAKNTQEILRYAAVLGYRFKVTDLIAAIATHAKTTDIYSALEQAERANLLKVAQTGRVTRYEFVHGLARQVLLNQIPVLRKQSIHFAVANSLTESSSENLVQRSTDIAYHLMNSGELADVNTIIKWLLQAGEQSLQATAYEEALNLFNMALEHISQTLNRANALSGRATASLNLGNIQAFSSDMLEAFELHKINNNAQAAAKICNELSFMMVWNNQVDEAIELIEAGLKLVGQEASTARCQLLSSMGSAYGTSNTPLSAQPFHHQAVHMALELNDQNLLADVYQNMGLMYWATFNGKQLETTGSKGSKLHRELGHPWKLAQCLWMQEAGLTFQGKFTAADVIAAELQPIALKHDNYGPLLCSQLFTAIRFQAAGDFAAAIKQADQSIIHCELASFPWRSAMVGVRSVLKLLAGDASAREDIIQAKQNILTTGMWAGTDVGHWLAGKAFLGDTDIASAYESIKHQIPTTGQARTGGQICLIQGAIEALMIAGMHDEAAQHYPVMAEVINADVAHLGFTFGLFERFAAMSASAANDWEKASEHFAMALQLAENLPFKSEIPRILYWHAEMLLRRNQSDDDTHQAATLLTTATTLSQALNMHGFIEFMQRNK